MPRLNLELELERIGDRSARLAIGDEPVAYAVEAPVPSSARRPVGLEFDAEQRLVAVTFGAPSAQLPAVLAPAIRLDKTLTAAFIHLGQRSRQIVSSSTRVARPGATSEQARYDNLRLCWTRDGRLYGIESIYPQEQFALSTLDRLGVPPLSFETDGGE
jgi:hypothetical protein